jgi:hypothetical protein
VIDILRLGVPESLTRSLTTFTVSHLPCSPTIFLTTFQLTTVCRRSSTSASSCRGDNGAVRAVIRPTSTPSEQLGIFLWRSVANTNGDKMLWLIWLWKDLSRFLRAATVNLGQLMKVRDVASLPDLYSSSSVLLVDILSRTLLGTFHHARGTHPVPCQCQQSQVTYCHA